MFVIEGYYINLTHLPIRRQFRIFLHIILSERQIAWELVQV